MELSKKLVQLRKKKGLTQMELAEALNVSRQAISRWEVGEAIPSTENLAYLSQLYGVSVDFILNDKEDIPEETVPEEQETPNKESGTSRKRVKCLIVLVCILVIAIVVVIKASMDHKEDFSMGTMDGEVVGSEQEIVFGLDW